MTDERKTKALKPDGPEFIDSALIGHLLCDRHVGDAGLQQGTKPPHSALSSATHQHVTLGMLSPSLIFLVCEWNSNTCLEANMRGAGHNLGRVPCTP